MMKHSKPVAMRMLALASVAAIGFGLGSPVAAAPVAGTILHDGPSAVILAAAGKAQSSKGAENFIGTMARRALDFLGNAQQTQAQKTESFRRLLEDNFDMETIGRFTLGRYWRTATPAQQGEYQRLFKKRVIEMYAERFSEYKGQKFEVINSRTDGEKDTIVSSKILPGEPGQPAVLVEWRVRQKGGNYRVVDVIVEGVSMSVTQRSDFSGVIQKGGGDVQVLIDSLKNRN